MHILHSVIPFLLVCSALYLMMLAGVQKRALERRERRRVCPSCGRDAERSCRCVHRR